MASPWHERLERRAREWEAESVADGGADVGDRLVGRGWRGDNHRVLAGVGNHQPGAAEKRDAPHVLWKPLIGSGR